MPVMVARLTLLIWTDTKKSPADQNLRRQSRLSGIRQIREMSLGLVSFLETLATYNEFSDTIISVTRGKNMPQDSRRTKLSDFIQSKLKEKGWSGLDFCSMLGGVPKSVGSKIANGKQTPTFMQIYAMSQMFDVPIENIVAMRLHEEACGNGSTFAVPEVQQRLIEIFKSVPVNALISNHWVGVLDRNDQNEMVKVFTPFLEDIKQTSGLAHKSHAGDPLFSNLQKAWLLRVRCLAREMQPSGEFSQKNIRNTINQLRSVMINQGQLSEVVKILDVAGIRLVLVECKNSNIDAVCTWLDDHSPVIGMTMRFDRIDNFWFNLRHELAHVEQGYRSETLVDCDLGKDSVGELEDQANAAAQEFCTPKDVLNQFLSESDGRFNESSVKAFAEQNSINPAVMAGQIRHRLSRYNILNKLITKYRSELLAVAPKKDGWGYVTM